MSTTTVPVNHPIRAGNLTLLNRTHQPRVAGCAVAIETHHRPSRRGSHLQGRKRPGDARMDSKRRLDDALDLAIGHQRPGVRLDQAMLTDAVRCKLNPWESQLDRAKICLKCLGVLGKIRLHSMSRSSTARRVARTRQETGNALGKPRLTAGVFLFSVAFSYLVNIEVARNHTTALPHSGEGLRPLRLPREAVRRGHALGHGFGSQSGPQRGPTDSLHSASARPLHGSTQEFV